MEKKYIRLDMCPDEQDLDEYVTAAAKHYSEEAGRSVSKTQYIQMLIKRDMLYRKRHGFELSDKEKLKRKIDRLDADMVNALMTLLKC